MNESRQARLILALWFMFLSGCGSSLQSEATLSLQYDKGFIDKYDSQAGTLSRDDCEGGAVKAQVVLTKQQRQDIVRLAEADGFFNLPHALRGVEEGRTETGRFAAAPKSCVIAPCWTARLKITQDGKSNEVRWDCGCGGAKPPQEVADIVAVLDKAIYDNPAVKAMKPVHCMFY